MRGSWRPNRTAAYWPPTHSTGHNRVFFSRFPGLLNRGPGGPASLGAGFLYCILSLTRLIPTDWISYALSYIIVHHPPSSCGRHNFALIQPVHGQGYNILIFLDRMYLLFTQVHFLFWQPGRVGGQYTTSAATYIYQPYANSGYHLKDFLRVMTNRKGWREKVKGIRAVSARCWKSLYICIYINCALQVADNVHVKIYT